MDAQEAQEILDALSRQPPAEWILEAMEHYRRTGTIRRKDLRRLLGSQADNDALREAVMRASRQPKAAAGKVEHGDKPGTD